MGSTSYWQAEMPARVAAPVLAGEHEADVVVIGAGITGAAAALWLARAGQRVIVLEARRVAAGASGRNGGFLLGGTADVYADAVDRFGHEHARRIWALGQTNLSLAGDLAREIEANGDLCGYRARGSLRLATTEDELRRILASIDLLRADNWWTEVITRDALPQALQSAYLGGSFHPGDGEIQPARFVSGIMSLAQAAGAQLFEESPVRSIDEEGEHHIVHTDDGAVKASWLILATNAWLTEVAPLVGAEELARLVKPTRGQMLVTAPVSVSVCACPCYAEEGYQYWRQLPDNRLVVGGWRNTSIATEDVLDETPAEPVQGHLETFVRSTLGIADAVVTDRWAGVMAFSPDGLPLVGRLPGRERCLVAGAYTGHGNGYAIVCAQALASLIAHPDATPEAVDLFDPARLLSSSATQARDRSGASSAESKTTSAQPAEHPDDA